MRHLYVLPEPESFDVNFFLFNGKIELTDTRQISNYQ